MVTGCREAAFQVVAPPLIQDRGGKHVGIWFGIYLAGAPVGLTIGYVYASFMSTSIHWGWDWAYYFLCILSLPPLMVLVFVKDEIDGGILGAAGESTVKNYDGDGLALHDPLIVVSHDEDDIDTKHVNQRTFTLSSELKACLSSPVLVALSLGWAALIGACSSICTFGVSFVVALELFDNERQAASWFGSTAAVAGVVGALLGGKVVDRILKKYIGHSDDARRGDDVDDRFPHPIMTNMLSRINMLVALSMLFIFPTVVVHNAVIFLGLLSIGWILLCKLSLISNLCSLKWFYLSFDLIFLGISSHGINRNQSNSNAHSRSLLPSECLGISHAYILHIGSVASSHGFGLSKR